MYFNTFSAHFVGSKNPFWFVFLLIGHFTCISSNFTSISSFHLRLFYSYWSITKIGEGKYTLSRRRHNSENGFGSKWLLVILMWIMFVVLIIINNKIHDKSWFRYKICVMYIVNTLCNYMNIVDKLFVNIYRPFYKPYKDPVHSKLDFGKVLWNWVFLNL